MRLGGELPLGLARGSVSRRQRTRPTLLDRARDAWDIEDAHCAPAFLGVFVMVWELPSFVEIDMNAEIGSYQEDFDGI